MTGVMPRPRGCPPCFGRNVAISAVRGYYVLLAFGSQGQIVHFAPFLVFLDRRVDCMCVRRRKTDGSVPNRTYVRRAECKDTTRWGCDAKVRTRTWDAEETPPGPIDRPAKCCRRSNRGNLSRSRRASEADAATAGAGRRVACRASPVGRRIRRVLARRSS
jgi:hypothetical protein